MSYSYTGLFKADSNLTSVKALYHLSLVFFFFWMSQFIYFCIYWFIILAALILNIFYL